MKVLPGDDIRAIMQWIGAAQTVGAGRVAAILLWMHNGLGYIYSQVSG
jgi:hypothetical protein